MTKSLYFYIFSQKEKMHKPFFITVSVWTYKEEGRRRTMMIANERESSLPNCKYFSLSLMVEGLLCFLLLEKFNALFVLVEYFFFLSFC